MKNRTVLFGLLPFLTLASCGGKETPPLPPTDTSSSEASESVSPEKTYTEFLTDGTNYFTSSNPIIPRKEEGKSDCPTYQDFIQIGYTFMTLVEIKIQISDTSILPSDAIHYETTTQKGNNIIDGIRLNIDRDKLTKDGDVFVEVFIQSGNRMDDKTTLTKKYTISPYGQNYPESELLSNHIKFFFASSVFHEPESEADTIKVQLTDLNYMENYGFLVPNETDSFGIPTIETGQDGFDFRFIKGHEYSVTASYQIGDVTYSYKADDFKNSTGSFIIKNGFLNITEGGKDFTINFLSKAIAS